MNNTSHRKNTEEFRWTLLKQTRVSAQVEWESDCFFASQCERRNTKRMTAVWATYLISVKYRDALQQLQQELMTHTRKKMCKGLE